MKQKQSKEELSQTATRKELIIGKKHKQELNKQQKAFNRLVKKLEKLRKDLEKTSTKLGTQLDYYGKHLHPLEQKLVGHRKEAVKLMYRLYKENKTLSVKDREVFLEIISNQLSSIFQLSSEKPDDEIMEIFEAVEGISYEKAIEEDFQAMKKNMAEEFEEMGFDIDLDGFEKTMSQEEMARKVAEMLGNLQEQAEAKEASRPKRKKTKKQIEKEEREKQKEEVKSKNIAAIYKQLARIFHPDLERDIVLKSQKEDLMKQLTNAYDKNDLHTLLRLELEWIQKEEDNLDKLSDEKLSIYNEVLKEQVRELEHELFFISQHPRYASLQRFSFSPFSLTYIDLAREKQKLEFKISDIEESIVKLKGENRMKELNSIISAYKKAVPKIDFSVVLEDFFK